MTRTPLCLICALFCAPALPAASPEMTDSLNASFSQQLSTAILQRCTTETLVRFPSTRGCFALHAGSLTPPADFCRCCGSLSLPPISDLRLPDQPLESVCLAFSNCSGFEIDLLHAQPSEKELCDAHHSWFFWGSLIRERLATKDSLLMRVALSWLSTTLKDNDAPFYKSNPSASIDTEVSDWLSASRFQSDLVMNFSGRQGMTIELDLMKSCLLVRTDSQWGVYKIDPADSSALTQMLLDILPLCDSDKTEPPLL